MMGERVAVLRRSRTGADPMGDAVWEWAPELVDNVLVRPLGGRDASDPKRPDGATAEYALAFPKAYTAAAAPLRGCRVALVDRGMDPADPGAALRVHGSPDVTRPCPTAWDLIAEAGASHG